MLLKILALLTAITILVYGIGAYFIFSDFKEVFAGFETDLPFITKVVLISYPYWLVALTIPIGIYIKYLIKQELSKKVKNRILFIFISMLLFSIVLLPLLVIIMYLPIFEMEGSIE